MELYALARPVPSSIGDCALTFLDRRPIDPQRASAQHKAYIDCLSSLGMSIISLAPEHDMPDSVFVEDTAVVLDEVAVVPTHGLESREAEIPSVAEALTSYRPIAFLPDDARLEGGDVLRIGRAIYVGKSRRTNEEGIAGLAAIVNPLGYVVRTVAFRGCLHMKSACTYLGRDTILANRDWIDVTQFGDIEVIDVDENEPHASNALAVNDAIMFPSSFPKTRHSLAARGFSVLLLDISELQKAEACVTCCSILFRRSSYADPA